MNYREVLKQFRTEVLELSTRELGEELGVDGSYVRQIESGAVAPSVKYLGQLCLRGLSIDALVKHTDLLENLKNS